MVSKELVLDGEISFTTEYKLCLRFALNEHVYMKIIVSFLWTKFSNEPGGCKLTILDLEVGHCTGLVESQVGQPGVPVEIEG